jgi:hypothetical protein
MKKLLYMFMPHIKFTAKEAKKKKDTRSFFLELFAKTSLLRHLRGQLVLVNTHKLFIMAAFVFCSTQAIGEIIEMEVMSEVFEHMTPDTFIVYDIDNTIIEPVQELGSDQWFYHRIQEYKAWGLNPDLALKKALREWTAIQNITKVKLVEPGIDTIIERLQTQGYAMIGLTTRGLGISTLTVEQLETVQVDLTKTSPTNQEFYFWNEPHGVLFRGGILFTAGTDKGEAFKKMLSHLNFHPKRVVFINDKASHLKPVGDACDALGIPFVGLRYSYTDNKVKNFRKHIADVQLHFFGHIISDEAACRILHESSNSSNASNTPCSLVK